MKTKEISEKVRFPRWAAIAVARELVAALQPHCERLIVAGSLRRKMAEVGDVEILFIPKTRTEKIDLLRTGTISLADLELERLLANGTIAKRAGKNGSTAWGDKNKLAIHRATGIPVDFFATSAACWYNYLVCRTGPAVLNMMIAKNAIARGFKWHPYGTGFEVVASGQHIDMDSEQAVFEIAGLPYLEPEQRGVLEG